MKRIERVASFLLGSDPYVTQYGKGGLAEGKRRMTDYFHWHVEILPRDVNSSRFKREDQFYTISTAPEEAAILLKSEKP